MAKAVGALITAVFSIFIIAYVKLETGITLTQIGITDLVVKALFGESPLWWDLFKIGVLLMTISSAIGWLSKK